MQCRDGLFVILATDGPGLNQRGVPFFIGGSLGVNRLDRCHGRLGLLEIGLKVRVVQPPQDIAGVYLLAGLEVDFHDSNGRLLAPFGYNRG